MNQNQNRPAPSGDFLGKQMRARLRMPAPAEPEQEVEHAAAPEGLGGGAPLVVPRDESLNSQIRRKVFGGDTGTEFTVQP